MACDLYSPAFKSALIAVGQCFGWECCGRKCPQVYELLALASVGEYTYFMVQSPSWEANWFAASQEIPRILWNPKVHYRTHKRPPPVPILIIKPTRCLFLKCIFGIKLYMSYSLRAGSGWNCSSILILLATCMTYTIAACTAKNSWWWTEELSETCRVLFQKWISEISACSWFYYNNLSPCTVTWTSK